MYVKASVRSNFWNCFGVKFLFVFHEYLNDTNLEILLFLRSSVNYVSTEYVFFPFYVNLFLLVFPVFTHVVLLFRKIKKITKRKKLHDTNRRLEKNVRRHRVRNTADVIARKTDRTSVNRP